MTVKLKENLESKGMKWAVTVRVDQKLNTIVMRNGRKILKFNVADKSGDLIECICYHETHDQFEPLIKEGSFVRIIDADIQPANKNHTSV